MATSKEYYDYVMEQLLKIPGISSRKMMGEYCIYYYDKVISLLCDNQLLLKPTESVLRQFPDADREYPYEGSNSLMVVVDDIENIEVLETVFIQMYEELPNPKRKK